MTITRNQSTERNLRQIRPDQLEDELIEDEKEDQRKKEERKRIEEAENQSR